MLKRDLEILVDLQDEYITDLEEYNEAILDIISQLQGTRKVLDGGLNIIEYPAPTNSIPDFPEIGIIIGGISGLLIGIGLVALLKALL